jgi:hypothetical protein
MSISFRISLAHTSSIVLNSSSGPESLWGSAKNKDLRRDPESRMRFECDMQFQRVELMVYNSFSFG